MPAKKKVVVEKSDTIEISRAEALEVTNLVLRLTAQVQTARRLNRIEGVIKNCDEVLPRVIRLLGDKETK